jgi:hypothetical protein
MLNEHIYGETMQHKNYVTVQAFQLEAGDILSDGVMVTFVEADEYGVWIELDSGDQGYAHGATYEVEL